MTTAKATPPRAHAATSSWPVELIQSGAAHLPRLESVAADIVKQHMRTTASDPSLGAVSATPRLTCQSRNLEFAALVPARAFRYLVCGICLTNGRCWEIRQGTGDGGWLSAATDERNVSVVWVVRGDAVSSGEPVSWLLDDGMAG